MTLTVAGAGAAGLSLGLLAQAYGIDVRIVEQHDGPGGLCRSHHLEGFTFDTGPHILGGDPDAVSWIVESTGFLSPQQPGIHYVEGQTRNAGWSHGEVVAHPFEDEAVGQRYMAKMWKRDPAELSTPALSAQPGRRPGGVPWYRYPTIGGYQSITDVWASRLADRIEYGVTAAPADVDVWTGPIAGGAYNSLALVTAGFEGEPPPWTALYLPEAWSVFHRLSFPSAFSPFNAPPGCWSVQGEMSIVSGARVLTRYELVEQFQSTLAYVGLLPRSTPAFVDVQVVPYAYPLPVPLDDAELARGHGRTGGRRYLNLDGVVLASQQLVARIARDGVQSGLRSPT